MKAVLQNKDYTGKAVLYMAMELSKSKWKLAFGNGDKQRIVTIYANDLGALLKQIELAKEKLRLPADCPVVSCYEAGRDGFWIHRVLEEHGIENLIFDSSSIEVNRRKRRTKTDKVDAKALLRLLKRYLAGEHDAVSVVRVPTIEQEDKRRLNRERRRLLKERGSHSARIKSVLNLHGVSIRINNKLPSELDTAKDPLGNKLGADIKAEILREYERYQLVDEQLKALHREQTRRIKEEQTKEMEQIISLMMLKGVGYQSSWILVMEFFAWREFKNRRELGSCAGLAPSPYDSGSSQREQGISKAGSRHIRSVMVELSWLWLRYQPDSELSQWFHSRFGNGKRMRRVGIVALARKLLIALWRYLEQGVVPEGAVLQKA